MVPLRPAQVVKAKVTAVAPHGIHLERGGVQIVVHVTDVPWSQDVSPEEYAQVGDELEVTILKLVGDGAGAVGWLPWPEAKRPSNARKASRAR
jgi:hypothetical protein